MTPDPIRQHAIERERLHANHASSRPLSSDYELLGMRGEQAFCAMFGGEVDLTLRPGGDGGTDHILTIWGYVGSVKRAVRVPVDVKTARKPYNLIVERGKVRPNHIYILAQYIDADDRAVLLGWEWGDVVMAAPCKDFGYGVINHYIPRAKISPMERLKRRAI